MVGIWGRLKGREPEKIDEAPNQKEAEYMLGEYRMAFGPGWKLWIGRRKDEP